MNLLQQIMSDPIKMGKEKGYDIPQNLANDPQAIVNYLIQSGQIPQPLLQMIAPLMQGK
ncbi:MAG: hypothetical protein J6Y20_05125 [Lachnospiraceae bacterium]|nr:hypothetical protein [Lachnospiraceae bacterium]